MKKTNSTTIENAVYNLCTQANIEYNGKLYSQIAKKFKNEKNPTEKSKLENILKNIELGHKTQRPLCQDTGQVIVFAEIGNEVIIDGKPINQAVNCAVEKAYKENYFRLSVVENALFDRQNTNTNTPAIIYTEITEGRSIRLKVLIKGAGAENYSALKMFKPTSDKKEIFDFIKETLEIAGEKACPPLVLGIGIAGTTDSAALLSKKAFFHTESQQENDLINELMESINKKSILDIKLKTAPSHIASLAVAVTINCHCTRHSECEIDGDSIKYNTENINYIELKNDGDSLLEEIQTSDIEKIKKLKKGECMLLTGEIYTARDAAHQRIFDYYELNRSLPLELKDKVIFYAGPCPAMPNETIGPIGPTTAVRMDKFNEFMFERGILASIGKGERANDYPNKYFTITGGISCLLAQKVKSSEIIAFEDLGTEAVRKLYVEKLPVKVEK